MPNPSSELIVTVWESPQEEPTTWTLRCDPPGGNHPEPAAACRALATAKQPFAPVPADRLCTQIYGGPQTATIEGTWRGGRVSASYRRTDGCEIARWNALMPVFRTGGSNA